MFDYAAWTQRLHLFLRKLIRLPGNIVAGDEIEPAATSNYHLEWLNSDKCFVPEEVRQFLLTASIRCAFKYRWFPPMDLRKELATILGDRELIQGGADLCQQAVYSNYSHRDRLDELMAPSRARLLEMQKLFPQVPLTFQKKRSPIEAEIACNRLPIAELPGRQSRISLDRQAGDGLMPIVYVETPGDAQCRLLSPSFEQFLIDWEATAYCYLDPESLAPWLETRTGMLRPDLDKAHALREILFRRETGSHQNL